jgi:hypothetical protein
MSRHASLPPLPHGWFVVANSRDIPTGEVKSFYEPWLTQAG